MVLKLAVIGCGHWGKNLVRNFASLGVLGAICDANESAAEALSATYNVPVASMVDILADQNIAAVVIAAPAEKHFILAKEALLAGKHVYVEKPLSLDPVEARELCDLAKEHQRILMVGHLLQYHPAFLKLKEMVNSGQLGRIQYVYSNRLSFGKIRTEENSLWSFAPHDISMILGLFGREPETVLATGQCYLHKAIADVTTMHLTFDNGQAAHIHVSWLHPFKEQRLVVICDKGMIVFDDSRSWAEKVQLYPHQVDWRDGVPVANKAECEYVALSEAEPLRLECQHFVDCVSQSKTPKTDGEEGLRVLNVLDAGERSMKSGAVIRLAKSQAPSYFVHDSAVVDDNCTIGDGTKIWHFSHVLGNSTIGQNCVIGQNVSIGPDVRIGKGCKIQNNVSVYKGVTLEEDVFCGPSMVFTNVMTPRANVNRKDEFLPTLVQRGASIGANATIVCGTTIGAYAFIGAGAVVTRDVVPHAVMVGNPARQIGWVSHDGERLGDDLKCPRTGRKYKLDASQQLVEV